jgi:creatinine amidohydrolase
VTTLLELPFARARTLASSGAPVVLCVNPIEYHGPHLSLNNDALVARGLARILVDALRERGHDWPWLFAGELGVGVDPVNGPGSQPVSFAAVRQRVLIACRQLYAIGAQRVILTTFHGSPLHNLALDAGVRWLRGRGVATFAPMNMLLWQLIRADASQVPQAWAHVRDPSEREASMERLPFDVHAGFLETSLALRLAPHTVGAHQRVPPCPHYQPVPRLQRASRLASRLGRRELALELAFMARGVAWYALRPFPGYTGYPHLADPAAGDALIDWLKPTLLEAAEGCLLRGESGPEPIMAWVGRVTLGGRLPRGTEPAVEGAASPPGSSRPG